jgi:hypothetical protein
VDVAALAGAAATLGTDFAERTSLALCFCSIAGFGEPSTADLVADFAAAALPDSAGLVFALDETLLEAPEPFVAER